MLYLSLKTKMAVAISIMITVLLAIAALSARVYLEREQKKMISNQQFTMVTAIADHLDGDLLTAQAALSAVASTMTPELVADPVKVNTFLAGRPDILAMFDNGVVLFSSAGKLTAGIPMEAPMLGKDFSHRDYFKKTMATRKPQIPEPFISARENRHPIVMFTSPVLNSKGQVIAVLGGSIDLFKSNFLGKLASIRLGDKGYLYLFNTSRLLLVHPDRQRVLKNDDIRPGVNLLLDAAINGFQGTGETVNSRGLHLISSFKRLSATGWILAGNLPQSEAYATVYRAQHYAFLALALALAISIPIVWLLTKHLAAPLISITGQVRELVGENDIKGRITVKSGDEIGVLAAAFNMVLDELDSQKADLRQQLLFSRVLIETIPYPLFYKNVQGVFLGCNKAFEAYIGLSAQELVGKTAFDFQPSNLAEVYQKADEELLENQGIQIYETSVIFADGLRHDVIFHKGVYPAADGTPGGIVGTMLDITERKRSEEAHQKTQRQMRSILDAAGEGIYGVDLVGRVTFINPAAAMMSGWSQEELLGAHQHSVLHHTKPDGTPYPVQECPIYAAFKDGKQHIVSDEVFWKKDGSSFPVEYVSNPIIEGGVLVGAVVVFKDTTERRQAEEQLLKLSQAIMQSPVAVIITDTKGKIEFVNLAFTQVTGYEPHEIIGQNPRLLQSGQTNPEVFINLWNTIASGRVWAGELHNRTKSGDCFWERATIFPIRDMAGKITCFMSFKENISEQKKLEAQLRQAQKMEAVGQLAGGVAHDFNNILTVIIGYGELLQRSLPKGDPKRDQMDQILNAGNRATQLTRSLLAFSRKQLMVLVPTDLNSLAKKHTQFLTRIIGEDVTLENDFDAEPLMILADAGQIEQVLMNLAANARDAMPGGGTLSIRTQTVHLGKEFYREHGYGPPGSYVLLTVSDIGMGMDQEMQKKVFEPFFTTKELGRGTGLGLSTVYGIVKQHGGYICVSSEPGLGTTFSIYLPLIEANDEKLPCLAPPMPLGGSETILLAEDDPAVRDLVQTVLSGFGYQVLQAQDGHEAVDLFSRYVGRIDLALFDVIMPKKSGKQACDELRKLDPSIKVLLLSGYTADMIESRGGLVDGVDLLMKPVQPMELARRVREMLDR